MNGITKTTKAVGKKPKVKNTSSNSENLDIADVMKDMMKQEEKKDIESALYNVLHELTQESKKNILTELSDNEIKMIIKLDMIGKLRSKTIYSKVTSMFKLLRISKGRASRKEILQAIKHAHPEQKMFGGLNQERVRSILS